MSFSQYESYKQSGANWLGPIPRNWSAARVKTLFEIRKRIAGELGHEVLSVTQRGLKVRDTESNDGQLSMDYSKYQLVEPDDFVMNHMDLLTGYVDLSTLHGVTSPDYRVFTARKKSLSLKFFLYLFQNGYRRRIFYAFGQGASGLGRWRMPTDSFNDFILPVPPLSEQVAIAAFLDRETAKIDALVAEQERLIELLKEKRLAVTSHAVTKGLDPTAPMKDTGVEWLGDVPEHWSVAPLRWYSRCSSGDGLSSEAVDAEPAESRCIRVFGGNGLMGYTTTGNVEKQVLSVGRVGALCGNVHIADPPIWITDNALILDVDTATFDNGYLARVLKARNLNELASKTAQPLITGTLLGDQRVPCPPIKEQSQIRNFLDRELSRIDDLTTEVARSIALMQERRAALISAAVTGKIDLRGLVEADATLPDVVAA
ncbi:restriction endonuclease subunit S [Bradyrhizobium sp. 179]|uniref:restriction endonuclease subunit S n=1 Tax=Bradyrhizobium sp. 179 TaxID=2782648 RepID=UPI001FF793F1|nr:restriction endonuclease subunit S [Bradyrhizobium sp. 179]MCK1541010.1 restriction endonuclease subunit S [Bradyrhizobium sp. 179]